MKRAGQLASNPNATAGAVAEEETPADAEEDPEALDKPQEDEEQ